MEVDLVTERLRQEHDRAVYLSVEQSPSLGVRRRLTVGVLLLRQESALTGRSDAEVALGGSDPL
ncbi:MAG TPA: hypothetical protein VNF91_07615 [Candidatus Acidoferrum sp.]|nr:hypothetical protein [Candidatus Acidoferrum sp.]